MSVRNLAVYRDPGTILIDQLREIYFDGELELTQNGNLGPADQERLHRWPERAGAARRTTRDVSVPAKTTVCNSARNYTEEGNTGLDKKMEAQSMETDLKAAGGMVWEIDQTLQEELARPIIYHRRCGHLLAAGEGPRRDQLMVNSRIQRLANVEDVWVRPRHHDRGQCRNDP